MRSTRGLLAVAAAILLGAVCDVFLMARDARKPFPVYDNMFYKGKPETVQYGLIPSNILYAHLYQAVAAKITNVGDSHHFLLYYECLEQGYIPRSGNGTGGRHEYPSSSG